jgi:hypothetical protein
MEVATNFAAGILSMATAPYRMVAGYPTTVNATDAAAERLPAESVAITVAR